MQNQLFIYLGIGILALIIGYVIGKMQTQLKFNALASKQEAANKVLQAQLDAEKEQLLASTNDKEQLKEDLDSLIANHKQEIEQLRLDYEAKLTALRAEKDTLKNVLTKRDIQLEEQQTRNAEKSKDIEEIQAKFTKEFENLANKILDEKSTKFTEINKENISQILNPLQEKIQHFERKVEDSHKESIDRHAALRQQIVGLKELNLQMSKEAVNLTKALKGDSKTQGNWGELILERVLEKSGLEKGREYELEKSFTQTDEEGKAIRQRPDVIIHLPDNKKMIVDSKVSLTAYDNYVNCDDEQDRNLYLKAHIASINRHVEQLSAKKYEQIFEIESPDFVLLFIPIEPAFALAINHDNELYNKAFAKNIVIVTPSTLLATLRTIDSMWNNEKQQQNALEIARQAGNLYDKFVGLTNDLIKVGNQLNTAKGTYDDTMKKLTTGSGNLIKRVEDIKKLGIKANKEINQKLVDKANDS